MPIAFEDVSFAYPGSPTVLSGLSFTVHDGEKLAVVGHMGSGKSTLVQLMNSLEVPTSGSVLVDGKDTNMRRLRKQVRQEVGLVFQYPERQLFSTTVAQDVAFALRNAGVSPSEVEPRCREALEAVGLSYDEVAELSPFALSGGQQRRVAIAGVLVSRPRYLVLDEPSAGLDPQGSREIRELVCDLNAAGTTVVMVTHYMEEAALMDRVLVLDGGKVGLLDEPMRVFSRENAGYLRDLGLALPPAAQFAIELAEKGFELKGPCLTVEQLVDKIAASFEGKA